ncbi:uncharacterized protein LOC125480125 isoform X1 [Pyrus x bretschneideri]|uniref:uncharacterized protein LOC125480125 isoform X1 n=1 Tax=Pyrus x bretschneideri TaxID=225117 RepID=UPI00202EC0B4|nr:uncharacterized protein LOC125480125 isoform X1 [Pyrus x bretschneideri]
MLTRPPHTLNPPMQKTNHFPKMKREQAAVYLVFALLMLRAQDADAELGLDFETSPARRSLVTTRFMLATWVSPAQIQKAGQTSRCSQKAVRAKPYRKSETATQTRLRCRRSTRASSN